MHVGKSVLAARMRVRRPIGVYAAVSAPYPGECWALSMHNASKRIPKEAPLMGLIFGQVSALPRCWLGGFIEEVPLSLTLAPC